MLIDAGVAAILLIFCFFGFRRGGWPSGFALLGTLIGTVLVDLWREGIVGVLTAIGLLNGWTAFLAMSGLLLLAMIVGYNIDIIIELGLEDAVEWSHRLVGALIGLVNGALVVTYLIRYAELAWSAVTVDGLISATVLALLVKAFLPWGMLALTMTGALVLALRFAHSLRTQAALYEEQPRSRYEANLRLLEHIEQALDRSRR